MTDFVTEKQFLRARKILRKLMYKNTYPEEEETEINSYFNYGSDGNEVIGVEGHRMLNINIPSFKVEEGDIEEIKNLEEFQEQDTISVSDRGFKITLNPESDE